MIGRDRGSASIWVLTCCALVLVVAAGAVIRGEAVLARHRAASAADLSALAAAAQIGVSTRSCAAAATVARHNDAALRSCRLSLAADGRSGTVVTRVALTVHLPVVGAEQVVASARAGRLAVPP